MHADRPDPTRSETLRTPAVQELLPASRIRTARVIGGSLGGLLAANLLSRAGWAVKVYERSAQGLTGRGAGIVTHPELFEALECCGLTLDDTLGVRVKSRITLAPDGSTLGHLAMEQVLTAWGQLFDLLRGALAADCYVNGLGALTVEELDDGVRLHLSDGRSEDIDLVVAADGIRSGLRAQFAPEVTPQYAGYVAWRGLVDESRITPQTHALLFDRFAFCLPPCEQILGYPVAGPDNSVEKGHRRFNLVWYRPADEAQTLRDLLTDSDGHVHRGGIAPLSIRPEVIAAIRRSAHEVLAPQFAELIDRVEQPFFQPIYDLCSDRLNFGHTVLLGDSAFVARPHCGMGVTKAAGDAMALVRNLAAHPSIQNALEAYNAERSVFGRAVVEHARRLGAYMQAQLRTPDERAMAERYRSPEAVMRETASSQVFTLPGEH
ncbi:MAG: FAD-dependent oxidoreductase [Betaproteobacteria bacterium]|nr:FAD-dependent oxidoreductase [Betaproteobacteria bacterium]